MIEQTLLDEICQIKEIEKSFPQVFVENSVKDYVTDNPFTQVFTYKEENELIGILILDIIYERMELIQIAVKETYQNKGYASKMIEFMLELAEKNKIENITLEVKKSNDVAIHLYEKYGFKKCAIRSNYYHGEDGILMERKMM